MWYLPVAWWRHQMETISALLVPCAGIHQSPVYSLYKGQSYRTLMFSLICAWTNSWVKKRHRRFETPLRSLWRHCNEANHLISTAQHSNSTKLTFALMLSAWCVSTCLLCFLCLPFKITRMNIGFVYVYFDFTLLWTQDGFKSAHREYENFLSTRFAGVWWITRELRYDSNALIAN